jgi:hypothetical protein
MTRYVRYLSCSIKIIISALIFLISISPGPLYDNSYAVMVAEIIPILYLMGQIPSLVAMVAHKKPLLCHSVQTCIVFGGLYLVYFAPIDVRVHFWNTAFYVGYYGNPFIDRADSWRNARLTDEGYWVLRFHAWPTCSAELIFDPQGNLKSPDGISYERFTRDYGSAFHIRSDVVSRLLCE